MKKLYIEPKLRAIDIDMESLIADSPTTFNTFSGGDDEEVNVGDDGEIVSLTRQQNNWDNEW